VERNSRTRVFAVAVGCSLLVYSALARAGADAPAVAAPETKGSLPAPTSPAAATAPRADTPADALGAPGGLDRVKAVPRKPLIKRHRLELAPFGSASLNDAYYEHIALGGSAIFYPNDAFGVGIGAEWMAAHVETDNKEAVRQNLTAVPAVFDLPRLFVHADAYFIPFYGKLSLFSTDIIHFDTYAVTGLGVAFAGAHKRPAGNIGLGQRFDINEWLAVRVEVRDHIFVDTQEVNGLTRSSIQNYVLFMVGASLYLPLSFEYTAP
jgi:outer membrane beta-barrel protein